MSVAGKAAATAVTTDAVAVSLKGFISTANHALNRSSSPGGSSDSKLGDEAHTEACGGRATATIRLQKSYDGLNKPLAGKTVAIKDNILTNTSPQLPTTCDSKILGPNFRSPFNATVVELLGQAGCEVVGKTAMDEFGMGSHSIHTNFGEVYQEDSQGGTIGGWQLGGSALVVKEGNCDFALGTDTGGSVRLPAAYTGVIGFKPSYGLLSRWGVIAYANSLDTVGILGREMSIVQQVFDILNQHDPKDPTSLSPATRSRLDRPVSSSRPLRIGIPISYNVQELDPLVRHAWQQTIHHISTTTLNSPISIHPISLPRTKQALAAYYVLAPSEASSNLAKYDGVRYGSRATDSSSSWADDSRAGYLYAQTRSQGFGAEVQRRILLGTYSLSAAAMDNYFIQAQKVRRLVQQDFDNVFARPNPLHDHQSALQATTQEEEADAEEAKVDFIVCPTAPTPPPLLDDVKASEGKDPLQAYVNDVFTVPASLAGLPAISIPAVFGDRAADAKKEENERNIGIQIIGQFGSDREVLDLARQIEESATK